MLLAAIGYPELERSDFDWVQSIRSQHDVDNYNIIDPHFTFVFPFSGINRKEFLNHIEKNTRGIKSITLNIRRITVNADISGEKWRIFLIPDKGYNDIIKLHDTLYTGILSEKLMLDIPYIPHITVGVFDNEQECKRIADELNRSAFSVWGQISSIDVISLKDNQVTTIRKIALL